MLSDTMLVSHLSISFCFPLQLFHETPFNHPSIFSHAWTVCDAVRYDVGVISGSLTDMSQTLHMSVIEREAVTSGLSFVAAIGAVVVSGGLMDRLGQSNER